MMKSSLILFTLVLSCVLLSGCDSNPTNEPTKESLVSADQKRAAAIDSDPNMTDADKKKMKEMLHLDKIGSPTPPDQGRAK